MSLADFLKHLPADQRHREIHEHMKFPDSQLVKEYEDKPIIKIEYECIKDKCDFKTAIKEIESNASLKMQWKSADVCAEIVKDIEANQDNYLPSQMDGYFITRMGRVLVHLNKKKDDQKSANLTGVVEYTDILKARMREYAPKYTQSSFELTCSIL